MALKKICIWIYEDDWEKIKEWRKEFFLPTAAIIRLLVKYITPFNIKEIMWENVTAGRDLIGIIHRDKRKKK